MLIGYTDEMTDQSLAELADWADYHAKDVTNPTWKRAYALIREGSDLLLRRRALTRNEDEKAALAAASHPIAKGVIQPAPQAEHSTDCAAIWPHAPHIDLCGMPCSGKGTIVTRQQ